MIKRRLANRRAISDGGTCRPDRRGVSAVRAGADGPAAAEEGPAGRAAGANTWARRGDTGNPSGKGAHGPPRGGETRRRTANESRRALSGRPRRAVMNCRCKPGRTQAAGRQTSARQAARDKTPDRKCGLNRCRRGLGADGARLSSPTAATSRRDRRAMNERAAIRRRIGRPRAAGSAPFCVDRSAVARNERPVARHLYHGAQLFATLLPGRGILIDNRNRHRQPNGRYCTFRGGNICLGRLQTSNADAVWVIPLCYCGL